MMKKTINNQIMAVLLCLFMAVLTMTTSCASSAKRETETDSPVTYETVEPITVEPDVTGFDYEKIYVTDPYIEFEYVIWGQMSSDEEVIETLDLMIKLHQWQWIDYPEDENVIYFIVVFNSGVEAEKVDLRFMNYSELETSDGKYFGGIQSATFAVKYADISSEALRRLSVDPRVNAIQISGPKRVVNC